MKKRTLHSVETRQRAVALRESGSTWRAIGEELGVAPTTVIRWCRPDYAERDRELCREYKEHNRAAMREYDKRYSETHRAVCVRCGELAGKKTAGRTMVCRSCIDTAVHRRRLKMVELWASGLTCGQVAEYFGWSLDQIGVEMVHARRAGYDLPYRYTVDQRGRRVAA